MKSRAARAPGRSGANPPSSPRAGVLAGLLQLGLECVVHLGAPLQCLREAVCTDRQHHELLDVQGGVGVRSTVDDVHHRHGEGVCVRSAEVAEQRKVSGVCCGLRNGEGNTQQRVRAELALVVCAVERDHLGVDQTLVCRVEALDGRAEHVENRVDCLQNALAAVALGVAVAQLVSLKCAGGCAGWNCGASHDSVFEQNLDLDGRVATGVKNFASAYCLDQSHRDSPSGMGTMDEVVDVR